MKISKEQTQENRRRVVDAASRLFRQSGFNGVGVADLMSAAGFTHGGFYNHFRSKEALMADALERAFAEMTLERERAKDTAEFVSKYLSEASRKAPDRSCPAAALAGDAARQSGEIKAVFGAGVESMVAFLERRLSQETSLTSEALRARALHQVSSIVGPGSRPGDARTVPWRRRSWRRPVMRGPVTARRDEQPDCGSFNLMVLGRQNPRALGRRSHVHLNPGSFP